MQSHSESQAQAQARARACPLPPGHDAMMAVCTNAHGLLDWLIHEFVLPAIRSQPHLHGLSILETAAVHPCYDARLALFLLVLPGLIDLDKWLEEHSSRRVYLCWFKLMVRARDVFLNRFMAAAAAAVAQAQNKAESVFRLVDDLTTAYVAMAS